MSATTSRGPREWTEEEVREQFLSHVRGLVDYWAKAKLELDPSVQDDTHYRLSGLAFSILAAIDGSSADVPKFLLVADPHSSDKEYNRQQGNNWYRPVADESGQLQDIAGGLHEHFYR